jgi:hypothetical protein
MTDMHTAIALGIERGLAEIGGDLSRCTPSMLSHSVLRELHKAGPDLFTDVDGSKVREFCAERAEYVTTLKQCTQADADYYRWQGHAEARRQLSERLGLPVAPEVQS